MLSWANCTILGFKRHQQHRHHAHQSRRQQSEPIVLIANAARPELAVVRVTMPSTRPSIIGRPDFFVRYGEKEKEAVASFDFLDELSTTSSSLNCSVDDEGDDMMTTKYPNDDDILPSNTDENSVERLAYKMNVQNETLRS